MEKFWAGFRGEKWRTKVDVADFILCNYSAYDGDENFLTGATEKTKIVWNKYKELNIEEKRRGGVLDIDTDNVSSLLSYPAGYLDKDNEIIVGFQTDAPLKRGVNPFGGLRMAIQSCHAYGRELSPKILDFFMYKTTHNDGVFRVYTKEMKALRSAGVITGLPDAYGRGRIIGDYRRIALYGADRLIEEKIKDNEHLETLPMDEDNIRLREEMFRQIDFLHKLKEMAMLYGIDISKPAHDFLTAVQWTYFGYLAAIKEQNGAAMSLGRVGTFLDIYAERDIKNKIIDEARAQEIIDQFVIKLRMARQLRTPDYDELFAGDPTWVTESLAGIAPDGRHLVTKNTYRFLNTLYNLDPNPEPNLTVLWSKDLPENFKRFCAKVSIDTSSIQYENDDLMRPLYGSDYGIACCVSAMKIGEQMQFFGARCNLPKILLMALNGGKDEMTGIQLAPASKVFTGRLEYAEVKDAFFKYIDWLACQYVNTMNVIHYMHDKYAYEKIQMALHNTNVERLMAFGLAGLSVAADSLSAIKYAHVESSLNAEGITEFSVSGDFPKYGNDDERADSIARELVDYFYKSLKKHPAYRNSKHTLSLLTITSNVVYGKKTGATPDGRASGAPFAPGANPMHNRESCGYGASLNSVASIPYCNCLDGISNTFTVTPKTLGTEKDDRIDNLTVIIDGYFKNGGHHINVNVFSRETLLDAQRHPEKHPNLTIRVSGYAVKFGALRRAHQDEVIARTFH